MPFNPDPNNWEWFKLMLYSLIAGIGGTLGFLMREMDSNKKLRIFPTLLQGVSAAFVGVLVFLLCHAFELSDEWTGVIVGVCGWLGASASIQLLERLVFQKLGVNKQVSNNVNEHDKG